MITGVSIVSLTDTHTSAQTWSVVPDRILEEIRNLLDRIGPPDTEQIVPVKVLKEVMENNQHVAW